MTEDMRGAGEYEAEEWRESDDQPMTWPETLSLMMEWERFL